MELVEQAAFLLHSRPYQEYKVIAEFLTESQGKVAAVVYLGKSAKPEKKALLQPFVPINIVLKGQGNLKYLSRIEPRGKSYLLNGNRLYSGFYLNELLVKLLSEHVQHHNLYRHYLTSLESLAQTQPIEDILRQFELALLDELGVAIDYSPVFEYQTQSCHYLPEHGFIPFDKGLKSPSFNRQDLLAIAEQNILEKEQKQTFKQLMRHIIHHLLDGKPLNSRKLFKR